MKWNPCERRNHENVAQSATGKFFNNPDYADTRHSTVSPSSSTRLRTFDVMNEFFLKKGEKPRLELMNEIVKKRSEGEVSVRKFSLPPQ
jgi:hypothetical protein